MKQKNDKYTYRVTWSEEDQRHVGLCAEFPSLSWLADTPEKELKGIRKIVEEIISDLAENNEEIRLITSTAESINQEAKYIIKRAQTNEIRIVVIGVLLFFSSANGDAWALDIEDGFALCLALEERKQPFFIGKKEQAFFIEWKGSFSFDGENFLFSPHTGSVQEFRDYPVAEIQQEIIQYQSEM